MRTDNSQNFGGDPILPTRITNQVVVDASGKVVLANPRPGFTGNLGQNVIEGPSQLRFDLSLAKKILVGEKMSFTVRADAINALNRPIWGNPTVDINSASFGRITSATGNRTITLNARFDF